MDPERGAPAVANHLAAHVNAAIDAVRDAYQGKTPDQSPESSSSITATPSSLGSPGPAAPDSFSGPAFLSDAWQVLIGSDRAIAEAGVEYDTEAQIDDEPSVSRLLELMQTDGIEVLDAVNEPEHQTFHTITRPGTLLSPPFAMPECPSTISRMKDNLNFDVSEFFDIDAAAEPLSSVSQSDSTPMPDGDSSVDAVLPSDTTKDKFDPEVSFDEYLKLSKLQEGARTSKSHSLIEKRGHLTLAPKRTDTGIAPRAKDEPKYRADPDVDVLKDAFKAGGEGFFLPAFSDPVHDAEFAAFASAGSVNLQFRGVRQEFKSRKEAATAAPSPSRASGQHAPEMSSGLQKDDEFARAGLIYVAHILQQNPQLSNTPDDTNHSYTKEEIQWARNYLSDEVKVWLKGNCGVIGKEKPTSTGLDKVLKGAAFEPELHFNHSAGSSSQKPEKQLPKATADNLNYWAEHDEMMSPSELDTEWDAFEKANPPAQTMADDPQTSLGPPDATSALTVFSPASAASFVTAENDEMSMISTFATPKPVVHTPDRSEMDDLNNIVTPKAGASASGDLSVAPIATKLSKILLSGREEHSAGSVPQAVEASTLLFTCATCNKVYKKKAYLLKHEAEGTCKPKTPNTTRLAIFAGVPMMKLSMTDQELIDNRLPSMEARNHKSMSYCTACNKEFSTVGRLRSHVLQSCPILRERGVYNKPQDQQLTPDDQGLAMELSKSTTTGCLLMDEREPVIDNSIPFSKNDLGNMQESLSLSDTPINVVGADNNFAPNTINGQRPSPQVDAEQSDKSEGPLLPRMRDDSAAADENTGLKYPARMRLFSEELALSSPHKSDPLDSFEDLPQIPKRVRANKSGGALPGFARPASQQATAAQDILRNPSSVTFSFTRESDCAIATQTLEELLMGSIDHTLQSLRMWPSFSMSPSASKSKFEFKVTAPQSVDLVTTLRELFPQMVTTFRGNRVLFVPGDMAASNSGSPTALTPSAIEAPAAIVVKAKKSKKIENQAIEQPRRSSRVSSGELESTSHTTVKTNMEDESQDSKEVKRRRSSSRIAEMHAEQDNPAPAEKKRQKTNN